MILLPHFDIPSGLQLGKIPQEFPFQGPVFFDQAIHFLLITAKAALQTDEAESQLVTIKREFLAHKGQSQEQLKNLQQALQASNDVQDPKGHP